MNALLKRIRPARAAAAPDGPERPETPVATAEAATRVLPAAAVPVQDAASAPAGVEPDAAAAERPSTRRRGAMRRRLRHLGHLRELLLRDIGGLVYEVHRSGVDPVGPGAHAGLVRQRLERLATVDGERRELEAVLGLARADTVLRVPGVGGTCPGCGAYFASDAHFCATCGLPVDGSAAPVGRAQEVTA